MIKFSCTCGHRLELADEEAGGLTQCPSCHRLLDVPTHHDLLQLADDGTYKMQEAAPTDPDAAAADMAYIYQKNAHDADGREIDLRLTAREAAEVEMPDPYGIAAAESSMTTGERRDPETGELITPLDLKSDGDPAFGPTPAEIPMARAVVNYATGLPSRKKGPVYLLVALLSPMNIAVMAFAYIITLIAIPLPLVIFALIAHFGNVIDESGPMDKDELPRPLRDLSWYDDLWSPFCNVFLGLMLCYGLPQMLAGFLHSSRTSQLAATIVFGAAGTFLFPAVLLTQQTSGTMLNLRPDRLLAVISASGRDYFVSVISWVIAIVLYVIGMGMTVFSVIDLFQLAVGRRWAINLATGSSLLAGGIFMMHYFCMSVGLLYRNHYEAFPWVLQRHISTRKPDDAVGLPPSRRKYHGVASAREMKRTRAEG